MSEGAQCLWAIDLSAGGAADHALLTGNGQQVAGRTVHHSAGSYRRYGKSDAKDAFVIAGQGRMRHDLELVHCGDDIAVDLRVLTSRRLDPWPPPVSEPSTGSEPDCWSASPPWNEPLTTRCPRRPWRC